MNWFEQYKKDFNFKTNYAVSKVTGVTRSSLDHLDKSTDWNNVQLGTVRKLAAVADKTLDKFVEYLEEQEEVSKMEKLERIFKKNGLNTDYLDILQEEGKVNLGSLDDLTIIDDVNNNTEYTAYFSDDYSGGVIIEK
ncbi:hypothetical protein [uncultured Enterococcus sp.]|uniref:hypothetical protein n=1 Tax=uncultured Enterococcus sp. TaxID=167972 RepID=UPI002AA77DA4|nr:hypothetical protein [uncultured Enterococcus sp.]